MIAHSNAYDTIPILVDATLKNDLQLSKALISNHTKELENCQSIISLQEEEINGLKDVILRKQFEVNECREECNDKVSQIRTLNSKIEVAEKRIEELLSFEVSYGRCLKEISEKDNIIENLAKDLDSLNADRSTIRLCFDDYIRNSEMKELKLRGDIRILEGQNHKLAREVPRLTEEVTISRSIRNDLEKRLRRSDELRRETEMRTHAYETAQEIDSLKLALQKSRDENDELNRYLNTSIYHEKLLHKKLGKSLREAEESQVMLREVVEDLETAYGSSILKARQLAEANRLLEDLAVSSLKRTTALPMVTSTANRTIYSRHGKQLTSSLPGKQISADNLSSKDSLHFLDDTVDDFESTIMDSSKPSDRRILSKMLDYLRVVMSVAPVHLNSVISLERCGINDQDLEIVFDFLRNADINDINLINLSDNLITDVGVSMMAAFIVSLSAKQLVQRNALNIDLTNNQVLRRTIISIWIHLILQISRSATLQLASTIRALNREEITLVGLLNDEPVILVYGHKISMNTTAKCHEVIVRIDLRNSSYSS